MEVVITSVALVLGGVMGLIVTYIMMYYEWHIKKKALAIAVFIIAWIFVAVILGVAGGFTYPVGALISYLPMKGD